MKPDQDSKWPPEGDSVGHVDSHVIEIPLRSPRIRVVSVKQIVHQAKR